MTGYSIDVEALRTAQQQNSVSSEAEKTSNSESPARQPPAADSLSRGTSSLMGKNGFSGWDLLCQAIDRVLFISYLAIILIFIASYLGGAAVASANAVSEKE